MDQDPSKPRPRNPDGTFAPGQPAPRLRTRKGSRNRLPASVQQCILEAAARIGSDQQGRDGVTGFLEAAGRENPQTLAAGIYKLIPPAKEPESPGSAAGGQWIINVLPIRSGTYLSLEEAKRGYRGEALQLEHVPAEPVPLPVETTSEPVVVEIDTTVVSFPARRSADDGSDPSAA